MKDQVVRRNPLDMGLFAVMQLLILYDIYLSQDVARKIGLALLLLFCFVLIIYHFVTPYVRVKNNTLYIYELLLRKPVVIDLSTLNKVTFFKRGSVPVTIQFECRGVEEPLVVGFFEGGSTGTEFYASLRENLKSCIFEEKEYIKPESQYLLVRLLSHTVPDSILVGMASILLVLLIFVMYVAA